MDISLLSIVVELQLHNADLTVLEKMFSIVNQWSFWCFWLHVFVHLFDMGFKYQQK